MAVVDTVYNRLLLARAVVILRDAGKICKSWLPSP